MLPDSTNKLTENEIPPAFNIRRMNTLLSVLMLVTLLCISPIKLCPNYNGYFVRKCCYAHDFPVKESHELKEYALK